MRIAIAYNRMDEREMLRKVISAQKGYDVAWVASSGTEAMEKTALDHPDLLVVDLELPEMGGAETTRLIMEKHPCAILIATPSARKRAAEVFEAMGNGALDVVSIPTDDEKSGEGAKKELLKKLSVVEKLIRREEKETHGMSPRRRAIPIHLGPLVVIGSSTGGPKAVAEILSRLPSRLNVPIVVVQHLDVQFAEGLVDWLDQQTRLKVLLAREGVRPERNTVYVAGTNDHLILSPDRTFRYVPDPKDYPYRPSVDRFFLSTRDCWPEKGVAVLLTGMGRDGAKGLLALRQAGWHTIAQDEATSVVFGMPKAAAESGAAIEILAVESIAESIVTAITKKEGLQIYDRERR